MIKNIIDLLQVTNGETESIKIAQGKYKLPMTFKCMINKIKKEYENSPNTFGSSSGKRESVLELLVIVGNQIASEYKDCEVSVKQGVPEINKSKS